MLAVLVDLKLSFRKHVELVLSVCYQKLSELRKRGLSDNRTGIVYDAVVLNEVLYALSECGGIHKSSAADWCFIPKSVYTRNLTYTQYYTVSKKTRPPKRV